jgi:hypothetical protein
MKSSLTIFLILISLQILICVNLFADNIKIIKQPKSVTECKGKSATLSVDAEDDENFKLNYQWYKDNKLISKAFSEILSFESINYEHSGTYFCRITSADSSSSIDSNPATLYVLSSTSIIIQPNDIRLDKNYEDSIIVLSFDAHINGVTIEEANSSNEFVKINWFIITEKGNSLLNDDKTYTGSKSNNLSIKLENLPDTSNYFAIIEGKCGIDKTRIVSVIKNSKDLVITVQIKDLDACEGNLYSLKTETKTNFKNVKIDYRWFKDGKPLYNKANLKGIFSDELIFNQILIEDKGKYRLEAQIKEFNIISLTNIINVKVNRKPEIVCIRIDTFAYNFAGNFIPLNVFYKYNTDSINIDIYKDGNIVFSYSPYQKGYEWDFNGIYNVVYGINKKDVNTKYWAIASNNCGISVSDTVTILKDYNVFKNRDPWYQRSIVCENDTAVIQLEYRKLQKFDIIYSWWLFERSGAIDYNDTNLIRKPLPYKMIFLKPKKVYEGRYQINAYVKDTDGINYYHSPIFTLILKTSPVLSSPPKNKSVTIGKTEVLFNIGVQYNMEESTFATLYYIHHLGDQSQRILTSIISEMGDFKYIKDVSTSDEGYFYAILSNDGYCGITVTDTVKVTVVPSGSTTSVNNNSDNENVFIIYPNPATDYINIQPSEGSDIQIFDMLGTVVASIHPMTSSHRMNIEHLSPGIYFIKIGNRVKKFVKM